MRTEDFENSWDEICEMAQNPKNESYYYGKVGVNLEIKKIRKKNFEDNGEPVQFETVQMGKVKILPCLVEAACQVGSNPPHVSRASLVMYLAARMRNFLPIHRTTVEMREKHVNTISSYIESLQWADFDEGRTRYHTNSIVQGGYEETCSSLINKGLCIGRCQLWDGTGNHEV